MWLNGAPHGFPVNVVSSRTRRVDVRIAPAYRQASYPGPYPIPRHAKVQGGRNSTGDRHLIALDRDRCLDYELLQARPSGGGQWQASAGVVFNLFANQARPAGVTSANAAGLPILPGLARYDEVAQGSINHALWFTAPRPRAAWIFPASHSDSTARDPSLPPMGLRVRLRGNVDVSHMPRQARIIAVALKRYGMILADTGMSWYFAGTPDRRWSERALRMLWRLTGRDFEVVNTGASVQQRGF